MPPLPFENCDSAWPVIVRPPSFGCCAGHVGALNEVAACGPPVQPGPTSATVSRAAAAAFWSAGLITVCGSHGSRAAAVAVSIRAAAPVANATLRNIHAAPLHENLR